MSTRGSLVIISSPSGAGKTTLAHKLLNEFNEHMQFSVSYTTRAPRHNEREGVDYSFVSVEKFEAMAEAGEFAEWALVHGNRYGTSLEVVEKALTTGIDVVFDVDWQGGQQLSEKWPEDALMIFVLPPDLDILANRLRSRNTDADDVIERRLKMAIEEIGHHDLYTHLVVNDKLDDAYAELRAIYLHRKEGAKASPAVVSLLQGNQEAGGKEHAQKLVLAGTLDSSS